MLHKQPLPLNASQLSLELSDNWANQCLESLLLLASWWNLHANLQKPLWFAMHPVQSIHQTIGLIRRVSFNITVIYLLVTKFLQNLSLLSTWFFGPLDAINIASSLTDVQYFHLFFAIFAFPNWPMEFSMVCVYSIIT